MARPSPPPRPRAGEGLCPRSLPLLAAGISPRAAAQALSACHPHTFRSRAGCFWLPSGHLHGQPQRRPLASATAPTGSHAHLLSSKSGPRRPRATHCREPHSAESHIRPRATLGRLAESLRHTSQALPGPARPPTSHLPLPAALTPRSDHPDPHPARTRPHSPVLAPASLSPTCDPTLPRTEGRLA